MTARRQLLAWMLLAALVGGCGSGSNRTGGQAAAGAGTPTRSATPAPQASDGRLSSVVVARPGKLVNRGQTQRISGRLRRPSPAFRAGVGAEDNCADGDVQPAPDNLPHVSDVILCLMNAMRADAGLAALRSQAQLTQASLEHSQDMVAGQYFAHDSQDGRDVVARLEQVGYIPKTGDWVVGENLAWGSGTLATPKALVNAWMNSVEHRDNLLAPDYQDVGVGVAYGTPSPDAPDGVTVTTDFGTRPQPAVAKPAGVSSATSAAKARAAARRRALRRRALRRRALRRCHHLHGARRRHCLRVRRR